MVQEYEKRRIVETDQVVATEVSPASRVIYTITNIVEALLTLRLLLVFLGANSANAFINFVYGLTQPLVAPFEGIFAPSAFAGLTIEWSTVLAMGVYAFVGWMLAELFRAITARTV